MARSVIIFDGRAGYEFTRFPGFAADVDPRYGEGMIDPRRGEAYRSLLTRVCRITTTSRELAKLVGHTSGDPDRVADPRQLQERLVRKINTGELRVIVREPGWRPRTMLPVADQVSERPSESPEEVKDWITIYLTDADDEPVPDEDYEITFENGDVQTGKLDAEGCAHISGIDRGIAQVVFPYAEARAN